MIFERDDAAGGRHEAVRERRVRERKVWRSAFIASVILHVVILILGPRGSVPLPATAAAGPDRADSRAADGAMSVIPLSSAPPAPIVRPAPPIFTAEVIVPELNTTQPAPELEFELSQILESGVGSTTGRDLGDAANVGIPGATGAGDAGTALEGRSRVIPPSPRGIIIPPTNQDLRGSEVEVWVFVNEQGQVVADSTRLEPPTSDRQFNEQLLGEAAQWVFEPARQNGSPVSAWFPYTISME